MIVPHKRNRMLFALILFCTTMQVQLVAQATELDAAKKLVVSGKLEQASIKLDQLAIQYPDQTEVLVYRAHVLAWAGDLKGSVAAFRSILQQDPNHLEALTGLGYALSWSNDFPNALFAFRDALELAPDNIDARKGLAFGYLTYGKYAEAKQEFETLLKAAPNNSEYLIGLARTESKLGNSREARQLANEILATDSNNAAALQLIQDLRNTSSFMELDLWGSYSKVDTSSAFGFRQLQLSYQFRPGQLAYARLDNSLTLDNKDFLTLDKRALAVWLGYYHTWNANLASRLELGQRSNTTKSSNQNLIRIEQVFSHQAGIQWKLGGYVGFEPKRTTEWLGWTSVYFPLRFGFSLEPAYFYSRDNSLTAPQQRFLLNGKWTKPGGLELNAGGFYGMQQVENTIGKSTLYGGFVQALYPLNQYLWLQMSGQFEKGIFLNGAVIALGVKMRI